MLSVKYYNDFVEVNRTPEEVEQMAKFVVKKDLKRVLDLGCGIGRHAIEWVRLGFDYYGVDIDEEHIREAEGRYLGVRNCRFRCDNVCRTGVLPEERGRDIVTAVGRLVHFIPSREDLAELFRTASLAMAKWGVFIVDLEPWPGRFVDNVFTSEWPHRLRVLMRGVRDIGSYRRRIEERVFSFSTKKRSGEAEQYEAQVRMICPWLLESVAAKHGLFLQADEPGVGDLSHLFVFARPGFDKERRNG